MRYINRRFTYFYLHLVTWTLLHSGNNFRYLTNSHLQQLVGQLAGLVSPFRPISITPVLCRTLERIIVREFIYPAILAPPTSLSFRDQYAFRPVGSTTVALIAILQSITVHKPTCCSW